MRNIFKDILKGKIVIVGIGNIMKKDDAFGPLLAKSLTGKTEAICIDAGTSPETYAGKIAKEGPDTVLIIDAVRLGLRPGEWRILGKKDILKTGFTTHDLSPHLFIEYLEKETGADIHMLGIEPEDVSFGQVMSDRARKTLEEITVLIKQIDWTRARAGSA